jgi:hypothetical protein
MEEKNSIDWEKLQMDYIVSDIKDVRPFLKSKFPERSDGFFDSEWVIKKTAGWKTLKKEAKQISEGKMMRVGDKLYNPKQYHEAVQFGKDEAKYGKMKLLYMVVDSINKMQEQLDKGMITGTTVVKNAKGLLAMYKVLELFEYELEKNNDEFKNNTKDEQQEEEQNIIISTN